MAVITKNATYKVKIGGQTYIMHWYTNSNQVEITGEAGKTLTVKLADIATALGLKVDKVAGKGLSTNDFTTLLLTKLNGITDGATKVEDSATNGSIKINGVEVQVYDEQGMKDYVDGVAAVGVHLVDPVKAAASTNLVLTVSGGNVTIPQSSLSAALSLGAGLPQTAGDRILLMGQTTKSENGIYEFVSTSAPNDTYKKVAGEDNTQGALTFVEGGTYNDEMREFMGAGADNSYVWRMFSKPDQISAGDGLLKVGTELKIKPFYRDEIKPGAQYTPPASNDAVPFATLVKALFYELRAMKGSTDNAFEAPAATLKDIHKTDFTTNAATEPVNDGDIVIYYS
jgi:hypothetical protein